jgi:hypothetical protein
MEQWMKNVQLNGAGIIIENGAVLANTLRLKIPQLGIDTYSQGQADTNGDLVFTGTKYTLFKTTGTAEEKEKSKKIQIYPQLAGSSEAGAYTMELNFKWTTATLNPGTDGKFTGKYELNFGGFITYLGNAQLKKVPAYVFINGLPDGADGKMTLTGPKDLVNNEKITPASLPGSLFFNEETSTATGSILQSSITNTTIDLAEVVNAKDSSELGYTITVQQVEITPQSTNPTITVELLMNIPLEFEVTGNPVSVTGYSGSYKALELEPLQGITGSDRAGDLFGRTGQRDDMLSDINSVELKFSNYTNTIIEGLNLFVGEANGNGSLAGKLVSLDVEAEHGLMWSDVAYPFNPQFKILVKSGNDGSATFKIDRLGDNAKLDFSLALEASAAIDQTINF